MDMDAVGRLKPGVTMAQAASDMNEVTVYPDVGKNSGIALAILKEDVIWRYQASAEF
jgi:hypothetical protein